MGGWFKSNHHPIVLKQSKPLPPGFLPGHRIGKIGEILDAIGHTWILLEYSPEDKHICPENQCLEEDIFFFEW